MEIYLFILVFTSIVFLFSFVAKLFTFNQFIKVFVSLGFNKIFSLLCAMFILSCEVLVSVLLLFRSTNFWGELILLFLILSFLFSTVYSQIKNLTIKCNCFGKLMDDNLGKSTYFRILVLLILFSTSTFSHNKVGITDIPADVIVNLILASINLMLIYFLSSAFIKYISIRKVKMI